MNQKKKKWANYVVGVLIVGLVMAYAPLLFSPPQAVRERPTEENKIAAQNQEADLLGAASEGSATATPEKENLGEGFLGLEEEGESLNELDKAIGE